ncbi:MAG: ABC transporter permease [Bryobacteraceae bacterium]|nr:ABC transporter permease [Bryobacteraceae bacterium]
MWRYGRDQADFSEEIRAHLEMETDRLRGEGLSEAEAYAQARREFGNVTRVEEHFYESNRLFLAAEDIFRDLRYILRGLRKSPAFTLLVIAVLAIGIGTNAAMFSLIDRLLLHPVTWRDPGSIVVVCGHDKRGRGADISFAAFQVWKDRVPGIQSAALSKMRSLLLTGVEEPESLFAREVTRSMFDMLGVAPVAGRLFNDSDFAPGAPPTVILSDLIWQKHFQRNPAIVGRQILLDGQGVTVIGVMPGRFVCPTPGYQAWIPLERFTDPAGELHYGFQALARLKPDASLPWVQRGFAALAGSLPPDPRNPDGWIPELKPYLNDLTGNNRHAFAILWSATGAVLLIACANAANLLLARASNRAHEFAVRASLGASRFQLVAQIVSECLLLSAIGAAAGVALAAAALPAITRFLPPLGLQVAERLHLTPAAVLVAVAAALVTGVLCAIPSCADVLRSNLAAPLAALSRSVSSSRSSTRLRGFLSAAEIALSIVLLVSAGLMIRSLSRLLDVRRLGMDTTQVLTARISAPTTLRKAPEISRYYSRILDEIHHVPGVRSASVVTILPFSNIMVTTSYSAEGTPRLDHRDYSVDLRSISPEYFKVLRIAVLRGRDFTDRDATSAPRVAIVNRKLAEHSWPGQDPVGRRVTLELGTNLSPDDWYTVVGVVENTGRDAIEGAAQAELYLPITQNATAAQAMSLAVRCYGDPLSLGPAIGKRIHTLNPDQPVTELQTMDTWLAGAASRPRLQAFLLEIFSGLALLLAVTGVFAVMSYSVAQRTHEIGIRGALGAAPADIAAFVVRMGLAPVAAGAVVGLLASLAVARLLRAELFETPPADPVVFGSVALILITSALIALWVPAHRAARIEPAITLRAE